MIWGFFTDRFSTNLAHQIIDFFKTDPTYGVTLVGGGQWWWRTETAPGWSNVFRRFDVYSPWNVGNYSVAGTNKFASTAYWSQDLVTANSAGMLYLRTDRTGWLVETIINVCAKCADALTEA